MKRIAIIGSTGSIGTQAIDVAKKHPDKISVVAVACHSSVETMAAQMRELSIPYGAVGASGRPGEEEAFASATFPTGASVGQGFEALIDLVRLSEVDLVVNALVGAAGLRVSWETLKAGKVLALANKESLVVGGDLIMPLSYAVNESRLAAGLFSPDGPSGAIIPIDSEHGAIYQCLLGEAPQDVSRLWVTASGGPFFGLKRKDLETVTAADALIHPTWTMGAKITIDSSTLMNKGLEVLEAHQLFSFPLDKISVVVQRQSAIHSMVEFTDGSVKAHLGTTDMRIPIQYALSFPERWHAPVKPLDFTTLGTLDFAPADTGTFRCLYLARQAGEMGGTMPCVMNAANEVAVDAFLHGRCSFLGIAQCVEAVMEASLSEKVESIEQLEIVDGWARNKAEVHLSKA